MTSTPDHCDFDRDPDGAYLPTPAQIRAACRRIQATWSPAERLWRARGLGPNGKPIGPALPVIVRAA
jgi:hypothetical protein